MRFATAIRFLRDRYIEVDPRQKYWEIKNLVSELLRLHKRSNRAFMRHVLQDLWRYITSSNRSENDKSPLRIRSAVDWLLRAQQESSDDGVSLG